MNRSDTIGNLATALAKAQQEITNPALDSVNPHFKNRYASLAAHLAAIRTPLAKHGLTVMQAISTPPGEVAVTTTLLHASGEFLAETVAMPMPDRTTVQQMGSTVTYLRRYSLAAMTLIVGEEEDDGEADRHARTQQPAPQRSTREQYRNPAPAAKPAPAPAAEQQATGTMDKFPDEGDHIVTIKRVVQRGKAWAVHVVSDEYGTAWVRTLVEDYATHLNTMVNESAQLTLHRVDANTLELIAIKTAQKAGEPAKIDESELPF